MTFPSEWLKLREPADLQARNRVVVAHLAADLSGRDGLHAVDLGAGTGSTVRALSPHLPQRMRWTLADNDPALLAEASWRLPEEQVETRRVDLDRDLEAVFDPVPDLVTCSALLDLVSEAWLDRLVERLASLRIPFYAALTYDGSTTLSPGDPIDPVVVDAINQHQHGDKGFGPALGPDAGAVAVEKLRTAGFAVESGQSDWLLDSDDAALTHALVNGWAEAAGEIGLLAPVDLGGWRQRRLAAADAGDLAARVGHIDILARPGAA
ncbi:methyltransferase domain-containing protein [Amorphus orientalis]|uniref:Phospholipid N-methyltransferase n=1 Tax=Amorphus orientalis TaxID=649198 RepID=A0AAE3VPM9_9HYPH|nr:class I SAM-dependent methyltransferase [Amorphus orientalis]MDQ0315994.1 phospholipid N-methyltransferase [Amorphus orientalis]